MTASKPITALLDTNIWLSCVTHELVMVTKTLNWGNHPVSADVATPVPRTLRNKSQEHSNAVYAALKTIADFVIAGHLNLYRTDETVFETMQLRRPALRGTEFDTLAGLRCEIAHPPVRRDFSIPLQQDAKSDFWAFLESVRHPRFLELKDGFSRKQWADLYHLWTAEHNRLDFFVALDEKFVNAVTLPKPLRTPVTVCTPQVLAEEVRARIGSDCSAAATGREKPV